MKYEVEILDSGATFSPDRVYRYDLWRRWSHKGPERLWIMLNPSTADEKDNDPTVERCFRRSIDDGFGSMMVCNIFALRSTNPRKLTKHADPVGPDNDSIILSRATVNQEDGGQIVCAWGGHGTFKNRGKIVLAELLKESLKVHVLGMTNREQPLHPLYVAYDLKPYQLFSK
jgi:hypothetical protein